MYTHQQGLKLKAKETDTKRRQKCQSFILFLDTHNCFTADNLWHRIRAPLDMYPVWNCWSHCVPVHAIPHSLHPFPKSHLTGRRWFLSVALATRDAEGLLKLLLAIRIHYGLGEMSNQVHCLFLRWIIYSLAICLIPSCVLDATLYQIQDFQWFPPTLEGDSSSLWLFPCLGISFLVWHNLISLFLFLIFLNHISKCVIYTRVTELCPCVS